ncbi:MAG: hypothetical protein GKR89_11475 [Candidatus Latescibacteria bacterium]|nr:hypothetical protein [Candidatus Latescibacterota bacterium]
MAFLSYALRKELSQGYKPAALVLWIGVPFLVGALITLTASGSGLPRPHVLIADQDESLVSNLLLGTLALAQQRQLVEVEKVDFDQGLDKLHREGASALIVLPRGLGTALLGDSSITIPLYKNPAQPILPEIVEQALLLLAEGHFYLRQIAHLPEPQPLESPLSTALGSGPWAGFIQQAGPLTDKAHRYLLPPVIQIQDADTQPQTGFALLIFPGVLLMALLFTAQGTCDLYWQERQQGTLTRLASTPASLNALMVAKLMAASAIMGAALAALLLAGGLFHQIAPVRLLLALIGLLPVGALFYNLFMAIQFVVPDRRTGALVSGMLTLPLLMLGGSFFPMETMPPWMAQIGQWTPNGYAVGLAKDILGGRFTAAGLIGSILIYTLASALLWTFLQKRNQTIARGN